MPTDTIPLPADLAEFASNNADYIDAIKARFGGTTDESVTPADASANAPANGDTPTHGDVSANGEDASTTDPADAGNGDDGASASSGASDAAPDPTPQVLRVPIGDGEFELDVDSAQRLLALGSWAKSVEQHADAFAAIEQGTGKVVSNADYEAYQAWQRQRVGGSTRATATDDALASLAEIDPDAAAEITRLRDENTRLATVDQTPRSSPTEQAFLAQQVEQRQAQFETAVEGWRNARGLSEDQAGDLLGQVVSSGVLAQIVERHRTYSPSGVLIQDADLDRVAQVAMNFALANDPQMFDAVQSRQTATTATPSAADAATSLKKARGASLASTPSASVSLPAADPRSMTEQERVAAMAGAIRAAGTS